MHNTEAAAQKITLLSYFHLNDQNLINQLDSICGGSVAGRLERWTCNPQASRVRPAPTARLICSL